MPSILVADDNTNIQKMVALAFEERGIKVVAVGNGEAAVRRIPDMLPDLVLADVFMPVRNGYEVCEFVKKDARFAHVPVILLVGAFDPLDEKEARRVGADGVLKKPFVPPDPLIAMVTAALEKNPRVAAENAKPKKAAAPPAKPEVVLKNASGAASPEVAQRTYGASADESDEKQHTAEAPEAAPPAVAAAPGEGEDFDAASTSADWRRSAMNFEVPADVANQVAFASDGDFGGMFPSEEGAPQASAGAADPSPAPPVAESAPAPPKPAPPKVAAKPALSAVLDAPVSTPPAKSAPAAKSAGPVPEVRSSPAVVAVPEPASPVMLEQAVETESEEQPVSQYSGDPSFSEEESEREAAETPEAAEPAVASAPPPDWAVEASAEVEAPADESAPAVVHGSQTQQEDSFFEAEAASEAPLEPAPPVPPAVSKAVLAPQASASVPAAPHFEIAPEDPAPPLALRDPSLIEDTAVRVTPEALLEQEEPSTSATYGALHEEVPPLYSIIVPTEASPEPAEPAAEPAPMPEFSSSASEPDAGTVDAVVQTILQKIEPQLHDLLSQRVLRPLIENLVQSELAKKQK